MKNGYSLLLFLYQIIQSMRQSVVIVVIDSDGGSSHFDILTAVCHGNAHAGFLDHGNIISRIACSDRQSRIDGKQLAKLLYRGTFPGNGRENLSFSAQGRSDLRKASDFWGS